MFRANKRIGSHCGHPVPKERFSSPVVALFLVLIITATFTHAQTPKMAWGKGAVGATNYFWVKNFSGATFGTAASNQFYLNWKMDNTVNGKGGEIWFFTSSATESGKTVDTAQNINYVPGNDCGNSWGDFGLQIGSNYPKSSSTVSAVPTYTVIESSTVRVRIKTNERNVSQNGDFFNINTQWTIYPNGQIFRWDSIPSISANDSIKMTFQGFFADSQQLESVYTDTTRLFGGLRNSSKVHNFGVASLGMRNGTGMVARPWNSIIMQFGHDAGRMGPEFIDDAVPYAAWNTFPLQNAFYVDIRSNSIDSLAMDSLSRSLRQPGTLAFSTGTAVTTSAGDLNNDGFNEREGAYVAAAIANTVHFTLPATAALCRFSPALRITGYTAAVKPPYVFVDSQPRLEGTDYNAYVNTVTKELVVQFMTTCRKNTDIFISATQSLVNLPPGNLSYSINPATYFVGTTITQNNCIVAGGGGAIDSFWVTPNLPAGLQINKQTGAIFGTPTAPAMQAPYTVTAKNKDGTKQVDLLVIVRIAPPGSLSFSRNPVVFIQKTPVSPDTCKATGGGAIDSFTVSPPLPPGIVISRTGILSGTPTAAAPLQSYRVTAVNVTSTSFVDLVITVNPASPGPLSYTANPAVYFAGVTIATNTCTNSGGVADSFSITPALSPELVFNRNTGAITGKPLTRMDLRSYAVRAYNRTGFSDITLTITVNNADAINNPVIVRGKRVLDNAHIELTVSQFSAMKSVQDPLIPWVDSVVVWYRAGSVPAAPSKTDAQRVGFSLTQMKASAEPFVVTISVPPILSGTPYYYIAASQYWHSPDSIPPFMPGAGDAVLMTDMSPPANKLKIFGEYPGQGADSAMIRLSPVSAVDTAVVVSATVICSFQPDTSNAFFGKVFTADAIVRNASADLFSTPVRNTLFKGTRDVVYCFVYLTGKNGVRSIMVRDSFVVGGDIPLNPITVLAATALGATQVRLRWNGAFNVDTFRIVYDTARIPYTSIPPSTLPSLKIGGRDSTTVVGGLNPLTMYYFGAQAGIGGQWSSITVQSSAAVMTLAPDPTKIPNTIVIDTAWFDSSTNRIGVKWHCDLPVDTALDFGITHGLTDTLSGGSFAGPTRGDPVTNTTMTTWIDINQTIVFNTSITVMFWLRKVNGVWSAPTDLSRDTVHIGNYSWQAVEYFTNDPAQTIQVFNQSVVLAPPAGRTWDGGLIQDTLCYFTPDIIPAGMTVTQPGFVFKAKNASQAFRVGIRYTLPIDRSNDLRMYQCMPDGRWLAVYSCTNDTINNIVWAIVTPGDAGSLKYPFICAVNRRRPDIVAPGGDSVMQSDVGFVQNLRVSANVANATVRFLYALGNDKPQPQVDTTLADTTAVLNWTVPSSFVKKLYGVRALICVNDGLHAETLDVSRRVRGSDYARLSTEKQQWVPLSVAAVLDTPAAQCVMNTLLDQGGKWSYDNTRFRLYRWWSRSANATGKDKWVEYSDAEQDSFKVVPGRLMWIKSTVERSVNHGYATTLSLRDTFTITLPPGNWTDFALPYHFIMQIGDIIDATGAGPASSLHFYKWGKSGSRFTTQPLYVPGIAMGQYAKRTERLSSDARDGYSVWNAALQPVTLRIPPTPLALSRVTLALAKTGATREWLVSVCASMDNGDSLPVVLCGFTDGQAKRSYYPQSPSFGDAGLRVRDPASGGFFGHAMEHRLVGGGTVFQLDFFNNSETANRTIGWRVHTMGLEESGGRVFVVDAQTGTWHECSSNQSVTLAPGESKTALLAVGDEQYAAGAASLHRIGAFALLGTYPNPFRNAMTVRFAVPYSGVARVTIELVDARGRIVWKSLVNKPVPGIAQVVWNGRARGVQRSSAGMYLLRITGLNEKGGQIGRYQRQVTFMP